MRHLKKYLQVHLGLNSHTLSLP